MKERHDTQRLDEIRLRTGDLGAMLADVAMAGRQFPIVWTLYNRLFAIRGLTTEKLPGRRP